MGHVGLDDESTDAGRLLKSTLNNRAAIYLGWEVFQSDVRLCGHVTSSGVDKHYI